MMVCLNFVCSFVQAVAVAAVVLFLSVLVTIRFRQRPFYRKLMAFSHEWEVVPLVRHLLLHGILLWKERMTGVPYGVHFLRTILEKIEKFRDDGCFTLFVGAEPNIVVYRADHMEKLLSNTVNISKGSLYTILQSWLGTGLLTATGSKWKQRRKMLTPAFHFRILDQFTDEMNRQAKIFVEQMAMKSADEDIVPYVTALFLDIVCKTIMGVDMNSQTSGEGKRYLRSLKAFGQSLLQRSQSPSQWIQFIYELSEAGRRSARNLQELHAFTKRVINERKAELEANPEMLGNLISCEGPRPFLDCLLAEHIRCRLLTLSDIREEVDTFMFEGHDTTSMGFVWAMYLLGRHPEVQKKIQDEIDEVFGADAEDAEVSAEHVKQMKYLDMALKETQRIFPSVPAIGRVITEEVHLNGKPVPVGTEVTMHILGLHRDPKVFPDPLKFDPDRFLPENSVGRSPFAFIPFSAGPRNCIGQKFALLEEKIILVWLLRRFNLHSLDAPDEVNFAAEMVLIPKTPIRVACTARR